MDLNLVVQGWNHNLPGVAGWGLFKRSPSTTPVFWKPRIVYTKIAFAVLLALLLQPSPVWGRAEDSGQPNLLFITFDTTRADRLGCYGFEAIRTPSIDRLAREGVTFENIYAQAPQTLPNHASIFTGLYTITHNVLSNGQKLEEPAITLAEMLSGSGYRTGAVVSAAPLLRVFNLTQGFDYYEDSFALEDGVGYFKAFMRLFSRSKINLPSERRGDHTASLATEWLTKVSGSRRPFHLWVHFFDPHEPYYFRTDFSSPDETTESPGKNEYGEDEAAYLKEIEFADYHLGRILDHLDELGLTDQTLTVFTADHGESLGEHEYRGHRQSVHENVVRVPLILRMPGTLPAGDRLVTRGMSIDILPTVLSLLEIPYLENSFQGADLLKLAEDEPRKLYSLAVKLFSKTPIRRTMIFQDYKFIEFDDPERNALYNIREDPGELQNLIDSSPAEAGKILWQEEIDSWWETHADLQFTDFKMSPEQLKRLKSLGYVN